MKYVSVTSLISAYLPDKIPVFRFWFTVVKQRGIISLESGQKPWTTPTTYGVNENAFGFKFTSPYIQSSEHPLTT